MSAALAVLVLGGVLTVMVIWIRERVARRAGPVPGVSDRQRIASSAAIVFGLLALMLAIGTELSSEFGSHAANFATLGSVGYWLSVRAKTSSPGRPQWEIDAERDDGRPVWGQPPRKQGRRRAP